MPEPAPADRICPYLRGRRRSEPVPEPSWDNHCAVVSAVHLPTAQQARFCLGGRYAECPRYIRQQTHPLPRYITGISSPPPPPPVVPPALPTLWWRRPWGRWMLRLVMLTALLVLAWLGWRWRATTVPLPVEVRTTPPIVWTAPTPSVRSPYLPPVYGPVLPDELSSFGP